MAAHREFSWGDVVDNRYRLDLRIHEGRWGDILKATDRKNNRPVAIRFFPSESENGEVSSFEKFSNLARNLSKITAPGLGIPIDWGEVPGVFYVVYRWAQGQTLEDRLVERGPLDFDQIVAITERLLTILSRAHQLRISHGMIRPGKIILDGLDEGNLHVSLVDFQVWRLYELASSEEAFDESRLSRKIIRYTGPEVVQSRTPLVPTDLFSLGLVILEMLQGTPYLDDNHRIALIARQLDAGPIDLSGFPIGPGFQAFLARCLEKEPSARLPDAEAALDLFHRRRDRFKSSVQLEDDVTPVVKTVPAEYGLQGGQPIPTSVGEVDVDEELFGRHPSRVAPVSKGSLDEDESAGGNDFDTLDRDELLGEEIDFDGELDVRESSAKEGGRGPERVTPKRTVSMANRLTPNSSLIEDDLSDIPDLDLAVVAVVPEVAPVEPLPESGHQHPPEDLHPPLEEARRDPEPSTRRSPPPSSPSLDLLNVGLVGLLVVALIGGIYFFFGLSPGNELEAIPEDGEITPAEAAGLQEVYPLRITTNPPALRVQVRGHGSQLSPVEIRVRGDEFPLPIRARLNAEHIIDTQIPEPTAEFHIDFDEEQ